MNPLQSIEFPSRKGKIDYWQSIMPDLDPPPGEGCCILERERGPGNIVNFTTSITPEMFREIVQRDFELGWVACVFTIGWV